MISSKNFQRDAIYQNHYQTAAPAATGPTSGEYAADGFEAYEGYESPTANQQGWSEFASGITGKPERPSDEDLLESIGGTENDMEMDRNFLKEEYQALKQKILDNQDLQGFPDLLRPLQTASLKIRKGLSDGASLESLEHGLESLREDLGEAVEAANERIVEKKAERETKTEGLEHKLAQIKNVPGVDETLETKAAELKTQLTDSKADLKTIEKSVKALEDEAKSAGEKNKLQEKFSNLATQVPNDGYGKDRTKDLATAIDMAMKNNKWEPVLDLLADLNNNHGQEADNAIRQVVGTLLYKCADAKEVELKKLLGCIDKRVLHLMAEIAGGCGEADANDYAETASKRAKYGYYGTGRETAAVLNQVVASMP